MEDAVDTVEHFFGVYLLYCTNPQFKGRTYIGFTTDPNRRLKQHNRGAHAGGARRTSNRGPWVMVLILHGFPNDIAALRFEWAWQHPERSRRLRHVAKKKRNESTFIFRLRLFSEMLQVGPWRRLPLTLRWLEEEYTRDLPVQLPLHMPICHGPVKSKKIEKNCSSPATSMDRDLCKLCFKAIENSKLTCISPHCDLVCHVICLSKCVLKIGEYVPIDGACPLCDQYFLWGDVIRKFKGCYKDLEVDDG